MAVSVGMNERGSKASAASAAGGDQHTTVLKIRGQQGRDSSLRAVAVLETLPGTSRVLLDEAGQAVVVRGTQKAAALQRALNGAQIPSTIVSRSSSRRSGGVVDQVILAFLILAVQIVLVWRDFGIGWPLLPAIQAGASMFVMFILGAPLLREAAAYLGHLRMSVGLALFAGAGAAWMAGALSGLRFEAAGQPYFVLATLIMACGLLAQAANNVSRAASSEKLQRLLQLMPDRAAVETKRGTEDVQTAALRPGRIVHVEHGARFPADGVIVSGTGLVDESTISGIDRPYRCGAGDMVLAGTLNSGDARRVRVTARARDAAVVLLARMAADSDPSRHAGPAWMDRYILRGFLAVVGFAAAVVVIGWLLGRDGLSSLETGLLIVAVGSPASLALAAPLLYGFTMMAMRRWGIWVRDPSAIELAGRVNLLVIAAIGVVTDGVRRVLKTTAAGGGDERRLLGLAAAALHGSDYRWTDQVQRAADRNNIAERLLESREYQGDDGVIAYVRDGRRTHRMTLGSMEFLTAQGIGLNPSFLEMELPGEPAAIPIFVAIDGHAAGAIWMTDPIRLTARSAVRNLRASGIETCLMGTDAARGLEQIAGTVETDSYVMAEDSGQQVAEIEDMRATGRLVAMVGHPVNDAAGLAAADVGIGFGALNTPAAARPGFLVRDASVLLVSACFNAARLTRARLIQSILLAALPMLAAVVLAMLGRLDIWLALILTGASVAVVLLSSLRMLRWRPRFTAGIR